MECLFCLRLDFVFLSFVDWQWKILIFRRENQCESSASENQRNAVRHWRYQNFKWNTNVSDDRSAPSMLRRAEEQIPGIRVYGISQHRRRTVRLRRSRLQAIRAVRILSTTRYIRILEGDILNMAKTYRTSFYYSYSRLYLGTICNLSSPVVKTSAQSMKITYTLTDV